MTEHTPTPWLYRPHRHDDWGWIRAQPEDGETVGPLIASVRSGLYETQEQLDEHRSNKTDPWAANAQFILKAVNNHDALVKAIKQIEQISDNVVNAEEYRPTDAMNDLTGIRNIIKSLGAVGAGHE